MLPQTCASQITFQNLGNKDVDYTFMNISFILRNEFFEIAEKRVKIEELQESIYYR